MNTRTLVIITALFASLCAVDAAATSHFKLCESLAAEIAKKDPAEAQSFLESCKANPKKQAWRKSNTPASDFDQIRYKCLLESKFTQPAGGREYFHDLFVACMKAHGYVYTDVEQ